MTRILLVDDHPILRHGVRALLETQRDLTVVAEGGSQSEALTAAREARARGEAPDVALVDLDLGAGEPGGNEVAAALLREHHELRVLILTAFDAAADVRAAETAGAVGYLVKDAAPAEIFGAVRAAAAGLRAFSPEASRHLDARAAAPETALTRRELEVLAHAAQGHSNRELAELMGVGEATVKTHLHHALTKLNAPNRQAAVARALERGLIRR
ncbi:MAG: response regulator transcription factor [Arthrobacter sp.]|jgi:DNA-binding NarL/FixJ family response regulator|nr:response regulator transcription factor [Arthrobacter sp.]